MSYRIIAGESIEEAVRRIATEQIDSAVDDISNDDLDLHETVHEFRKRCKKIRGLVRWVRPGFEAYADENRWFRDRARQVAELRDASSMLECLDALIERYANDLDEQPFPEVRESLVQRRDELADSSDADARLQEIREELADAKQRVCEWKLSCSGVAAVQAGMKKTYRRARRAMHRAAMEPTAGNFHEWRKRAKYSRYHIRLLTAAWPRVLRAMHAEAHRLTDLLGDDHDLAVLRETVTRCDDFGPPLEHSHLLAIMDRRSAELRAWSFPLGRRLFELPPKRQEQWIDGVLSAWTSEQRQSPPLDDRMAKAAD